MSRNTRVWICSALFYESYWKTPLDSFLIEFGSPVDSVLFPFDDSESEAGSSNTSAPNHWIKCGSWHRVAPGSPADHTIFFTQC